MPPQPLSSVRRNAKVLASPDAITLRPNLAPLIAQIIARWADIEANVASILAFVLHAEAGPTVAMIQAVRSATAQMDMIEAAGAAKLQDPELEVFEAVLRLARRAASKRNNVAHHIWAYSPDLPEALLLIEPPAYLELFVAVSAAIRDPNVPPPDNQPDRTRTFVYREQEFLEIISEMKVVARCTTYAINYLHGQHPARHRLYAQLFAEPLFETAVLAIRKARPPIPEPEPPP